MIASKQKTQQSSKNLKWLKCIYYDGFASSQFIIKIIKIIDFNYNHKFKKRKQVSDGINSI